MVIATTIPANRLAHAGKTAGISPGAPRSLDTVCVMLAGREDERAAVAALLDAARGRSGGALLIRGVAGTGKSALLTDAVDSATDMRVLRTSGVESESPLAFAALQRLLWPLRERLTALPDVQRTALSAALGEATGHGERFVTYLGALTLLADAGEECPVVVIIDDAQWLDDASAGALLFAARRLQNERVALLFAVREGDSRSFEAPDLASITLRGLAGTAADTLLAGRTARHVDPAVRDQLVAGTGGNPLALVEVAELLSAEQLAGQAPLPIPLPLTGGVERAFLDRYRRLTEPAQQYLLVAAADDTGRFTVVRDAADRLAAGAAGLDEAERTGLLRIDGDGITLYHPLVRSAVYRAASSAQRRAVHGALAEALRSDPDRRAWHLAAATDRPDEQVVAALDGVAQRAAGRGGHEAASAAWARAAELTATGEDRGRRLYQAAAAAWLGAHPSRASALAQAAAADVSEPVLRARLLTLQGQIEWNTRSLQEGYELIVQAATAAAGTDDAMAQQLAMLAASLSAFGARSRDGIVLTRLTADAAPDETPRQRATSALLRGFDAVARTDWATAAGEFRSAFSLTDADVVDDHVVQPNLGIAALHIDDDERGLRLHEQQLTAARRAGALNMVEHALSRGALLQIATGAWTAAATAAAEALTLTVGTGHPGLTAYPTAELALLAALRGDDHEADRYLAEVTAIRGRHPLGISEVIVADLALWASGLRAGSDPVTALHHLERMSLPALQRMAALDRLQMAVRGDRLDLARAWLEELEQFTSATGAAAGTVLVEHGRALLADGDHAEEHFQRALAHEGSRRLPDRARTELAYGEYLRRAGRRVDARRRLRTALSLFEDLGAASWAERAAQELRASGESARRRDVSTVADLTAQERQVTALVRRGLSNKDVAAQLFVSPRTVDFHLRNVFRKLEVTSRAELTVLDLDV